MVGGVLRKVGLRYRQTDGCLTSNERKITPPLNSPTFVPTELTFARREDSNFLV